MPAEEKVKRKLSAILSADVKGYSLLMADDEAYTVKKLEAYRHSMSGLIQSHSGRVVDAVGDNLLAEFSSAVDAVRCSVEIQTVLQQKNADLPADKRLEFRIGVNIGDVIQEGDRIYGNGVNVAARIEGLAESGGICISRNAYSHVRDKLELGYEFLGEHSVKNIKRPIRVYKVLMGPEDAGKWVGDIPKPVAKKWIWATAVLAMIVITSVAWQVYQKMVGFELKPASMENMAYSLPDKPSIAVLPFDNLSGNPEDEFLADGISESIITALSKTPNMFVISRNSTFTYKGKAVKVQQVAEELSVQYVLEGSLQKSNDQMRINAQLIDAISGNHMWAEKYDRNMSDIFSLQDDITMKIITALQVELSEGEQANIIARGTENLEAYLKVVRGLQYFQRINKETNTLAQKLAQEAISLDSSYPAAYLLLSKTQMRELIVATSKSPKESIKLSIENAKKAISLDASLPDAQAWLGWLYTITKQFDQGIASAERALALNPNSSDTAAYLGLTLNYAGRHEEAIKMYKKAIRLSPIPSVNTLFSLCIAYRDCGRYEEGISAAKKAVHLQPDSLLAHTCLASCYALSGRDDEAKAESAEVLKIEPNFSVAHYEKRMPYKDPADTKLVLDSFRKAGLPE